MTNEYAIQTLEKHKKWCADNPMLVAWYIVTALEQALSALREKETLKKQAKEPAELVSLQRANKEQREKLQIAAMRIKLLEEELAGYREKGNRNDEK